MLASAEVREGKLWITGHNFKAIVLPDGSELPGAASQVVARFEADGGQVIRDDTRGEPAISDLAVKRDSTGRPFPASDQLVLGRFVREGRDVLLLVNVGTEVYAGSLAVETPGEWWFANPADGRIDRALVHEQNRVHLSLPGHSTVLLVGPAIRSDREHLHP
jgi:hypothetical protein